MDQKQILKMVDHTLLKQESTWDDIKVICDDAIAYETASVCIPPCFIKDACSYTKGKLNLCTVIGFPNGNNTTQTKVFEAQEALKNGAGEIDMVINIGDVKAGEDEKVKAEIAQLRDISKGHILKVIIETCLLTDEEKIRMCHVVTEAGADYIKTSTGFSTGGATPEDVKLLKEHIGPNVKVKASGGISSFDDAKKFVELGASRLGTSRLVKIAKEGKM